MAARWASPSSVTRPRARSTAACAAPWPACRSPKTSGSTSRTRASTPSRAELPPVLTPLPIDAVLAEIGSALDQGRPLVLEAPPGAGKTTRVPWAIHERFPRGEVIVAEPRRLAARLTAARVASERGERLGESVGYSVRFEEVSGPKTRIRYVTEGVLLRRLLAEPELPGVEQIVLDEFHERSLLSDLLLVLLSRLRQRRPELGLTVMSATLDAEPVATLLAAQRV